MRTCQKCDSGERRCIKQGQWGCLYQDEDKRTNLAGILVAGAVIVAAFYGICWLIPIAAAVLK